jgi:radical SAM protein with 4Fe4S-binding SPASM domain
MTGLKNLMKAGLRKQISLCITVTSANFNKIGEYAAFAAGLGIPSIVVTPAAKLGRAQEIWEKIKISPNDLQNFYENLYRIEEQFKDKLRISGSIKTALLNRKTRNMTDLPCSICQSIAIDVNGNVYPCSLLMSEQFKAGNAFETSLDEIISGAVMQEFRKIASDRRNVVKQCSFCRLKDICAAGCMAKTYMEYGSFFAPDPDCNTICNLI